MTEPAKKKRRGRPPARDRAGADPNVTLIKKYGNRRLYDTRRSRYVTLDDLVEVIARGEEIQVLDAQTGEDLTKRVMTQIILHEEERKRLNLLPMSFLRKLIQYRDESLREFFQKYMSLSLDLFMQAQKDMERRMEGFGAGFDPATMSAFFPWLQTASGPRQAVPPQPPPPQPPPTAQPQPPKPGQPGEAVADELAELHRKLADLESRLKR
ncbi:MAG TPA: polyhydroxyalkanoate synthesis regulator DNA-binding domain-containing protein [Polyangia bacterium]|nr:polyhydroxyalkanoate synthesis regulator DNA-binding domain-containing protein [Polyangia bacterium]